MSERKEDETTLDLSDTVRNILRVTIESTTGAGQGVVATMIAAAAMQCYLQSVSPGGRATIEATNRSILKGLRHDLLARFVRETIDDMRAEAEAAIVEAPGSFYGQA